MEYDFQITQEFTSFKNYSISSSAYIYIWKPQYYSLSCSLTSSFDLPFAHLKLSDISVGVLEVDLKKLFGSYVKAQSQVEMLNWISVVSTWSDL